jgi:hypothetical protein
MSVKITQEQADYLETFGDFKSEVNKKHAVYYISRFGWDYDIKDGDGRKSKAFNSTEQLKMVDAVINGYEVDIPKYKFYNFYNITKIKKLYYAGSGVELTGNMNFAEVIEKGSKEYLALESLGFCKEKV